MNKIIINLNKDLEHLKKNPNNRKKNYKSLVKKYHPDLNGGEEIYNKCLIIINNIYASLSTKKDKEKPIDRSKYSSFLVNGKYQLKQSSGAIVNISDKEYFIFRLGFEYIISAQDLMLYNSGFQHNKNEITLEASGKLYQAFTCFNDVIKMNTKSNWYFESIEKLKWAYRINQRITRSLITLSDEKTLSINL